jgi:hypothetical protein
MSDRITDKQLQYLVDRINELTGSPMVPWTSRGEGKGIRANIGNYHLSGAYGGVCLHRMMNEGGGVNTPLGLGHVPKRELYNQLRAYVAGLEERK